MYAQREFTGTLIHGFIMSYLISLIRRLMFYCSFCCKGAAFCYYSEIYLTVPHNHSRYIFFIITFYKKGKQHLQCFLPPPKNNMLKPHQNRFSHARDIHSQTYIKVKLKTFFYSSRLKKNFNASIILSINLRFTSG